MRVSLILLCASTLFAQDGAVFHAAVSLVHVDAEVVHDGRIIAGLGKGDFQVKDEGALQPIVQFSADEQPLDLILLFDISGSMMPAISRVAAAGKQALDNCVRETEWP